MFEVVPDYDRRMLRLKMRGFWDDEVMAEYLEALREGMAGLQRTHGCKYVLIDMSDYPIQSREIAEGHARQLRYVKRMGGMRVALVMESALSRLQANRVAADTGEHMFDSEQAAVAWLLTDDE